MKKYILYVGIGCFAFYGFTFLFKSEFPGKSSQEYAEKKIPSIGSPRGIASENSELKHEVSSPDSKNISVSEVAHPAGGPQESEKHEEGPASSFPKYYNIKIKDKYAQTPKHIIDALAKEENKMKEITKKAQLEGDELVMCNSRLPKCVGGSNETHNCITQQRNCNENSGAKKLTEFELVNVIGRNSFEKYRNHLQFIEKTGSSIRGPGSLEKY